MKGKDISWITVWLIVVCVLLVVTGTYAAYSSVEYVKGVAVAKVKEEEIRFSSNYLKQLRKSVDSNIPEKVVTVGTGEKVSAMITVCNYPQNDRDNFHDEAPIVYDMTATLLIEEGAEKDGVITYQDVDGTVNTISRADFIGKFSINDVVFNSQSGIMSFTNEQLSSGDSDWKIYTLTCSEPVLLNLVAIEMKAVPTDTNCSCQHDDYYLAAKLLIAPISRSDQPWKREFVDDLTDPSKVDAFNCVISGTATDTVKLSWKKQFVEPSRWSLAELPLSGTDEQKDAIITQALNDGEITFEVGGIGDPTSYRLQFYRMSGFPSGEDRTMIEGYVSLYGNQSTQVTTPADSGNTD